MTHVVGRGRYARSTYPQRNLLVPPTPGEAISVETAVQASASRLADVSATTLKNGTVAYVRSTRSYWSLQLNSALTPDNVTVITASGVAGAQWVRFQTDYRAWQEQAVWFIDPANVLANDENDGLTANTPLSSMAELVRRWDGATLFQNTAVTIVSDLDAVTDAQTWLDVKIGNSATLRILGTPVDVVSGNTTATTPTNTATNVQQSITDAAMVDWAAHLWARLSLGPPSGAGGTIRPTWVAKAVTPTEARISDVVACTTTPGAQLITGFVPGGGVPYRVQTLPNVRDLRIETRGRDRGSAAWRCVVQDVVIDSGALDWWSVANRSRVLFAGCSIKTFGIRGASDSVFAGCLLWSGFDGTPINVRRSTIEAHGCTFRSGIEIGIGSLLYTATTRSLSQGGPVSASFSGYYLLNVAAGLGVGAFDSPGPGYRVGLGSRMQLLSGNAYGAGNTTYGLEQAKGGFTTINAGAKPTVVGALGDVILEGAAQTWAALPVTLNYQPIAT